MALGRPFGTGIGQASPVDAASLAFNSLTSPDCDCPGFN